MDNLTHTLFALTLARTTLGRAGRGTTAALVLASSAPDVDIIATAGGAASYLQWHRGPTHGPLGVVGLGLLTAALVWIGRHFVDRYRPARAKEADAGEDRPSSRHGPADGARDASFATLAALSMLAVLLHVLMDLPTSYGTRLLSPFDWHWYAADWMPIVDVYLLIALATGLAFGRRSEGAGRRNAAIVFVFMAANYGVRAAEHYEALENAPRLFGPLLPRRCDPSVLDQRLLAEWPRPGRPDVGGGPIDAQPGTAAPDPTATASRCLMELAAMPNFTSPFRWRVIAQMSNAYELHDVDLLDSRFSDPASDREAFWRLSIRYPNQWTPEVFEASRTRLGQVLLGFSRFPAARSIVDHEGLATVRWTDMRFVGGAVGLDQPARQMNLFTGTVRIAADGTVLLERYGR